VEYIEDFDGLMETCIMLFGAGEYVSVAPLCAEFWQVDAQMESSSRRALLEVARDRFPVQARPLLRILHSLAATGDFRGLEGYVTEREVDFSCGGAAWAVYQYFDKLTTLTQVIPFEKEKISYIDIRNTSALG
jgi:nuclear pore complex protein Nup188